MPFVYRVQHKYQCTGPYNTRPDPDIFRPKKYKRWKKFRGDLIMAHGDAYHPSWDDDEIMIEIYRRNDDLSNKFVSKHEYISGFRTLEQLYRWFDGWLDELKEFGFEIAVYEVEEKDIIDGFSEAQIAFCNHNFFEYNTMELDIKKKVNRNIPVRLFGRQTKTWSDALVE